MIFRIRLPRFEDLLGGLEADESSNEDTGRVKYFPIPIKMPPDHECGCLCSAANVNLTWRFVWGPIIVG